MPVPGQAVKIDAAAHRKRTQTYPELARRRCRLVVVGVDVGGRFGAEAARVLRMLARHRADGMPAALRLAAQAAWVARWAGLLAIAAQRAFASSLLELPLAGACLTSTRCRQTRSGRRVRLLADCRYPTANIAGARRQKRCVAKGTASPCNNFFPRTFLHLIHRGLWYASYRYRLPAQGHKGKRLGPTGSVHCSTTSSGGPSQAPGRRGCCQGPPNAVLATVWLDGLSLAPADEAACPPIPPAA